MEMGDDTSSIMPSEAYSLIHCMSLSFIFAAISLHFPGINHAIFLDSYLQQEDYICNSNLGAKVYFSRSNQCHWFSCATVMKDLKHQCRHWIPSSSAVSLLSFLHWHPTIHNCPNSAPSPTCSHDCLASTRHVSTTIVLFRESWLNGQYLTCHLYYNARVS